MTARTQGAAAYARAVLARARAVTGLTALGTRVLHGRAADVIQQDYQSERTYAPYVTNSEALDTWYDPMTGAERTIARSTGFGAGPNISRNTLGTAGATWIARDTTAASIVAGAGAGMHQQSLELRPLNVLVMLGDWSRAPDVEIAGRCMHRDYERLVLERAGVYGPEYLFVDEKSGFPVKLTREVPHYLWGQQRADYLYLNWDQSGGLTLPVGVALVKDDIVVLERAMGTVGAVARDSAPRFTPPDTALVMAPNAPRYLQAAAPDTQRVGANAFLLVNAGYTELVALVRDTVFLFDATQGEARSRLDSAWIGRLFPGRHPIALVVTDLAWPHIAGVRFWVAKGATVISHPVSRGFLERVVARRWTRAPDALELKRSAGRAVRVSFSDGSVSQLRAGGGIRLLVPEGIGTEGALLAYLDADHLLWAGDYLQNVRQPTLYASDVLQAVIRAKLSPARVAAQHLPVVTWETVTRVNAPRPAP